MMNEKIFQISDKLHEVMFDEYAVERRCVPSNSVLEQALLSLVNVKNKVIATLTSEDYENIFKIIKQIHNYDQDNQIPSEDELKLIIDTFKYVIQLNNRYTSTLNVDDLWVLRVLYNILSYENDRDAYLDKFKTWRATL